MISRDSSSTDRAAGFYPAGEGSIPSGRAKLMSGGRYASAGDGANSDRATAIVLTPAGIDLGPLTLSTRASAPSKVARDFTRRDTAFRAPPSLFYFGPRQPLSIAARSGSISAGNVPGLSASAHNVRRAADYTLSAQSECAALRGLACVQRVGQPSMSGVPARRRGHNQRSTLGVMTESPSSHDTTPVPEPTCYVSSGPLTRNCPRCEQRMGKHPRKPIWRCGNVNCPLFDVEHS